MSAWGIKFCTMPDQILQLKLTRFEAKIDGLLGAESMIFTF